MQFWKKAFAAGIIFYVSANGQHGLISAPSDQSAGVQWGCYGITFPGASGTAIGVGNQNTVYLVAVCGAPGIPAELCGNLLSGGYRDWYLLSKDELTQLYLNQAIVGGFAAGIYWSSSDDGIYVAWVTNFSTGNLYDGNKNSSFLVRAIRSF